MGPYNESMHLNRNHRDFALFMVVVGAITVGVAWIGDERGGSAEAAIARVVGTGLIVSGLIFRIFHKKFSDEN